MSVLSSRSTDYCEGVTAMAKRQQKTERIYVKVASEFDSTGYARKEFDFVYLLLDLFRFPLNTSLAYGIHDF